MWFLRGCLSFCGRWKSGSRTDEQSTSARSWRKNPLSLNRREKAVSMSVAGGLPPNRTALRTSTWSQKTDFVRSSTCYRVSATNHLLTRRSQITGALGRVWSNHFKPGSSISTEMKWSKCWMSMLDTFQNQHWIWMEFQLLLYGLFPGLRYLTQHSIDGHHEQLIKTDWYEIVWMLKRHCQSLHQLLDWSQTGLWTLDLFGLLLCSGITALPNLWRDSFTATSIYPVIYVQDSSLSCLITQ